MKNRIEKVFCKFLITEPGKTPGRAKKRIFLELKNILFENCSIGERGKLGGLKSYFFLKLFCGKS